MVSAPPPPPAAAAPSPAPASTERPPSPPLPARQAAMAEEGGFGQSGPKTFKGDRGGSAEDADLLAELRAISSKSGGG
eukprot:4828981-Ditylum_brightwellii.AAC.1